MGLQSTLRADGTLDEDMPVGAPRAPQGNDATEAAAPVVRNLRRNRRSEGTITSILEATEEIILRSGADRISILDVCALAGVSRGTFYRYFASQDDLLDAFSRHKRDLFHRALTDATAPYDDPDERFDALIRYLDKYLDTGQARRLLLVAPEYALGFFQRIFHDSIVRLQEALAIVFDAWDARLGVKFDRSLVCEMLIRYVLSEQLVPGGGEGSGVPSQRVGKVLRALTAGAVLRR